MRHPIRFGTLVTATYVCLQMQGAATNHSYSTRCDLLTCRILGETFEPAKIEKSKSQTVFHTRSSIYST
jgi:hypothetical protein